MFESFYISLVRKFMSLMLAFFALAGANKPVEAPAAAPAFFPSIHGEMNVGRPPETSLH